MVKDIKYNLNFKAEKIVNETNKYIVIKQYSIKYLLSVQLVWQIKILKVWRKSGDGLILINQNEWHKYDILVN